MWRADDWPVFFTAYRESPPGEWQEVGGPREPVTTVQVEIESEEVLLVRDSTQPPLTVSSLEDRLSGLMERHREFVVDTCEPPIAVDGFGSLHIDLPVVGAGRDDGQGCYLLVYASSKK